MLHLMFEMHSRQRNVYYLVISGGSEYMSRLSFLVSLVFVAVFSLFFSMAVRADENVTTTTSMQTQPDGSVTKVVETRRTVVTPVPTAKEVVATPEGFVQCFTVAAGWFNDLWVPAHRVCQYSNSAQGVAWVEGYWGCNKATAEGVCTNWEWKPGHWQKTFEVY